MNRNEMLNSSKVIVAKFDANHDLVMTLISLNSRQIIG